MYISIRRVRRMLHVHQINSIHLSKKGKKKNRWFGWLWMFELLGYFGNGLA